MRLTAVRDVEPMIHLNNVRFELMTVVCLAVANGCGLQAHKMATPKALLVVKEGEIILSARMKSRRDRGGYATGSGFLRIFADMEVINVTKGEWNGQSLQFYLKRRAKQFEPSEIERKAPRPPLTRDSLEGQPVDIGKAIHELHLFPAKSVPSGYAGIKNAIGGASVHDEKERRYYVLKCIPMIK